MMGEVQPKASRANTNRMGEVQPKASRADLKMPYRLTSRRAERIRK
jgi:hypothetical protein